MGLPNQTLSASEFRKIQRTLLASKDSVVSASLGMIFVSNYCFNLKFSVFVYGKVNKNLVNGHSNCTKRDQISSRNFLCRLRLEKKLRIGSVF